MIGKLNDAVNWLARQVRRTPAIVKVTILAGGLFLGALTGAHAQAGDGTLGGATNNTAEVPITAGITNTGVSVYYVVLPGALVVGLSAWGLKKFMHIAGK